MINIKNKYLKFLANAILFFSLVFLLDLAIGSTLRHFYFNQKSGDDYHLTYSIENMEDDLIILGSSRASHHYIPQILEDSINMHCFNTGMDASFLFNTYAMYKAISERHKPEIIVMEICLERIMAGHEEYDELASLLPYYWSHEEMKSIVQMRSRFEKFKLISRIYPFNSALLEIAKGLYKIEDLNEYKGYSPLYGVIQDTTIGEVQPNSKEVDLRKLEVLEAIAFDCQKNNVKLVFVQSPRFRKVNQKERVAIINELVNRSGAVFWNYVSDTLFLKPEYFVDEAHLNDFGAQKFSQAIAGRIKREILNDSSFVKK